MNKIINLAKKNIGVSIIVSLVFVFLVFTLIYIFFGNNISEIEENKIKNSTKDMTNYFEDLVDSNSNKIDKYIYFTLDYSSNINGKNELTITEIYEFIKEHFTLKTSEEDIRNIGITPMLVEKNVIYNIDRDSYKINGVINSSIDTPIKYYKLEKLSKVNKKKYKAIYRVYTITNPIDMLNYYIEKNAKEEGIVDEDGNYTYNLKDILPIRNYISGTGKLVDLKNSIDDDVDKYSKKGGTIKIIYVIENDNVLIDQIK